MNTNIFVRIIKNLIHLVLWKSSCLFMKISPAIKEKMLYIIIAFRISLKVLQAYGIMTLEMRNRVNFSLAKYVEIN